MASSEARADAAEAWAYIAEGLSRSDSAEDRQLAEHVDGFLSRTFGVPSSRAPALRPEPQVDRPHEKSRATQQPAGEILKSPGKTEIQR